MKNHVYNQLASRQFYFREDYQRLANWVWTMLLDVLRAYRRDQRILRREYLLAPHSHHIPWRVWQKRGAFLTEVIRRQDQVQ